MITIQGNTAVAKSDSVQYQMPLKDFMGNIGGKRSDIIYPDGLKLLQFNSQGNVAVAVYEIPPAVHNIRWIADNSPKRYGPGTKYVTRRLSLPYVVLVLPMAITPPQAQLHTGHCECFVRNEPISETSDKLMFPPLLNVSIDRSSSHPLAWLCTQYLNHDPIQSAKTLNEKIWKCIHQSRRCLLESGFNYSSEHHEGNSHYSSYIKQDYADERIKDVKKWEKASIEDPLFVLKIAWRDTGHTIDSLLQRTMNLIGAGNGEMNAGQLESIIFNKGKAV